APVRIVITGDAATTAHEIVCHEPSVRDRTPPSAYAIAHTATAANSSPSEGRIPLTPPLWRRANVPAARAPIRAAARNARPGRARVRSTATTAGAAGSSATTSAPWRAGASGRAKEVSSGNPTTAPAPTTATLSHSRPRG